MPTAIDFTPDSLTVPPYPVRRWTVDEYHHLAETGVLTEDDQVELLEGWIVPKMTKNPLHEWAVTRLDRLLDGHLSDKWIKRTQCAINTADSEPEPDHSIVRGPEDRYLKHHPGGVDIAMVIEVAETSLSRDRLKASMYAAEEISVYWIVNLVDHQVEVHTFPDQAQRIYRSIDLLQPGDIVELTLAGRTVGQIPVDQILPPED